MVKWFLVAGAVVLGIILLWSRRAKAGSPAYSFGKTGVAANATDPSASKTGTTPIASPEVTANIRKSVSKWFVGTDLAVNSSTTGNPVRTQFTPIW